jgi:membrane protein DedA with SNARE-associated domain/membrane-associated phospholipid phosphatase
VKPVQLGVAVALVLWTALRWRQLGWGGRAIRLLAAAGFAVYGAGLVELPNLEHTLKRVGETLGPYTYALVGALAFLETGAFVGLIAPGETAILLGGVIAGQGRIDVIVLLAIVWTCAVAGDLTSYALGRRLGRDFLYRHGPRVKITHERLEQVEVFFDRHGGSAILIGRFIGLIRAIAPFVAGASKLPLRRFLPYDIVGAGLWGSAFVLLGYVFWHSFDRVLAVAKQGAFALATVLVVIVGVIAAYRYLRVPEHCREVVAWIEAQLERPALRPLRPVWAHVLQPLGGVVQGPLRFVRDRLTPGGLGLELTSLVAVVLVGGFGYVLLADTIHDGRVPPIDQLALKIARELDAGFAVDAAKAVTALGSTIPVLVVTLTALGLLLARRRWPDAAVIAVGSVLSTLAIQPAKHSELRPRPPDPLVHGPGWSFPSGHAIHAVAYLAIAIVLARLLTGARARTAIVAAGVVLALLIGLSRVVLRVHYLTDVIAGWALAGAIFATCAVVALVLSAVAQVRHNERSP